MQVVNNESCKSYSKSYHNTPYNTAGNESSLVIINSVAFDPSIESDCVSFSFSLTMS